MVEGGGRGLEWWLVREGESGVRVVEGGGG